MTRSFRITARALRQAERAELWWRKHRPGARDLFRLELAHAIARVRETPEIGVAYAHPRRGQIRRLLMPRSRYHLYYRIDEDAVVLLLLWSASRIDPTVRFG